MLEGQSSSYNPLAIKSIADSVVRELIARPWGSLPPSAKFNGAGIYAIYYHGAFPDYVFLARQNLSECSLPIYVGKAVPAGGRKGIVVSDGMGGSPLFNRLSEHADSIRAATNLRIEDFRCRYLVVEDLFIELAERSLIQLYKPVWNACLDGFGNHDPGGGRYNSQCPGWDVIHPGRAWAFKMQQPNKLSEAQWHAKIADYLAKFEAGLIGEVTVVDDGEGGDPS